MFPQVEGDRPALNRLAGGWNRLIAVSPTAARVFDGHATTVISDGHVVDGALRQLGLRRSKPGHAVRLQNGGDISQVAHGSLEPAASSC